MKKILIVALFCMTALAATAQTTFYIECRDSAGTLTPSSLYEELGAGWYSLGSSAKSTAPGIVGNGSRFSFNTTIGDAQYVFKIGNHASFVAGTAYDIYITTPAGSSIDAAGAQYVIYDNANPEGTPIQSGGVSLTTAVTGNQWFQVASNVTLGAGAAIKVSEGAPQAERFYADSIRVVPFSAGPTPTPTPTATPWPTPYALNKALIEAIDNPADGSANTTEFGIGPTVPGPGIFPWFFVGAGTVGYNGSNYWYRDNRVASTVADDTTATAVWTFQDVPAGAYALGYYVPDSAIAWDNCYYRILCPDTSVDLTVVVSQNNTDAVWCRLADGLNLSGDVQVVQLNIGRFGETIGSRMFADAIGLFSDDILTPSDASTWPIYE